MHTIKCSMGFSLFICLIGHYSGNVFYGGVGGRDIQRTFTLYSMCIGTKQTFKERLVGGKLLLQTIQSKIQRHWELFLQIHYHYLDLGIT